MEIGQVIKTQKSGITGLVQEIVKNDNGSMRVRLDTPQGERWTTVK